MDALIGKPWRLDRRNKFPASNSNIVEQTLSIPEKARDRITVSRRQDKGGTPQLTSKESADDDFIASVQRSIPKCFDSKCSRTNENIEEKI